MRGAAFGGAAKLPSSRAIALSSVQAFQHDGMRRYQAKVQCGNAALAKVGQKLAEVSEVRKGHRDDDGAAKPASDANGSGAEPAPGDEILEIVLRSPAQGREVHEEDSH